MKGWKTVTGLGVSAIGQTFGFFGEEAAGMITELSTALAQLIGAIVGLGGLGFALYGRWTASTPIFNKDTGPTP